MNKSPDKKTDKLEQKVVVQTIAFSVIIIVVILTLVSFIRIYSGKKEQILKDMRTEATLLETVIADHLNYSRYFISIIGRNIQKKPKNLNYIHHILKEHFISQDFNMLFGWRKYSWINNNFLEVVTSTQGIISTPKYAGFIKEILGNTKINNTYWKNKIVFYSNQNSSKERSLKIINNISDNISRKYLGSVVLSYDIDTMIKSLNKRKTNSSTNFIILDKKLKVIAQSKPFINNVINDKEEFATNLHNVLKKLDTHSKNMRNLSYLDMINGVNYFVSSLKGLPFIIIVNINNDIIKKGIIDSIAKKFVEVCVFAFVCLFIVISIYKREMFLRTKAEKAMLVANNATKAKTDFLAFTAHEIRSPLGFILTGSEVMTKELIGQLPKEYKEYADGIHENSQIILNFITDILDENQIIEGKFKIVNTLANVIDIVDKAIKISMARYNTRIINIVSNIEENLPLLICDKRRILQVISNLISNSIKYSKDNTTIEVTGKIIKNKMEIKIIDQGIGMNEQEIPIALSTYGTIHNVDYSSTGSYGLGLPIVKMLLDVHDAKLSIESSKGKGTTVKIIFPAYKLIYNKN